MKEILTTGSRPLFVTESRRAEIMTSQRQHLAYAIVRYLQDTVKAGTDLKEEDLEGLEVATQCLETAFSLDGQDDLDTKFPLPASLLEVFMAGLQQLKKKSTPQASVADKEAADKLKAEGNEFMKADNVNEAVGCYSRALELDPNNAVYYCNRAAAFNKLGQFESAIEDCTAALDLDSQYSKAYNRKGTAHLSLHQFPAAKDAFARALELDPQNESYKMSLEQVEQRLQESQQRGGAPNLGGALGGLNLGGMNLPAMLNNPALMNMASNLMSNPAMQQMMANVMMGGQGGGGGGQEGQEGLGSLLQAGQQLAQEVQARNPELVDQLRQQMRNPAAEGEGGTGQDQPPADGDQSQGGSS